MNVNSLHKKTGWKITFVIGGLVVAALLLLIFVVPFSLSPDVVFSRSVIEDVEKLSDQEVSIRCLKVTNQGVLPVWYFGYGGVVRNYAVHNFKPKESSLPPDFPTFFTAGSSKWTRLDSGSTARIMVNRALAYEGFRVGIELSDWRGGTHEVWSPRL